jgi:hypothetical protein
MVIVLEIIFLNIMRGKTEDTGSLYKMFGLTPDGAPSVTLDNLATLGHHSIDHTIPPLIDQGDPPYLPPIEPPERGGGGGGGKGTPWGFIAFGVAAAVGIGAIIYAKVKSHAEKVRQEQEAQQNIQAALDGGKQPAAAMNR